jgi:lipoprotein-releasing system ATP-binding protein
MENHNVILEVEDLSKSFHKPVSFLALDRINFSAYKGEFLTLIGKSGSGKSTLLYCISTMDRDYEGKIWINGDLVTGKTVDELARIRNTSIGFVFQFHYLLPEFSCLKNVMLPALKMGKYSPEAIETRAYEKLSLLGLSDQALKPSSKLSGGQQQRVAIARALINEPDIIMCDEPTGNLDSKNAGIVVDAFMQLVSDNQQTVIAVTHDKDISDRSHRTIELADGRIIN